MRKILSSNSLSPEFAELIFKSEWLKNTGYGFCHSLISHTSIFSTVHVLNRRKPGAQGQSGDNAIDRLNFGSITEWLLTYTDWTAVETNQNIYAQVGSCM